ncbi:uncharacterized protein [Diabrotica undecimpunctata]|uniref:uncharacterized protein n=1 Tax=Diabrotica undecimpunctata TaxID=50387 RepID=UPI003B636357
MTEDTKRKLEVFEIKVLKKIFGPINENGVWRSRYNQEIYQLVKEVPVSEFVKLERFRWAGHVVKMEAERLPKSVLDSKMQAAKSKGRPRKKWEDKVAADAQNL